MAARTLAGCLLLGWLAAPRAQAESTPAPAASVTPAAPATPTPVPADPAVPLTEIADRSQGAIETLNAIEAEPLPDNETSPVRDTLPDTVQRTARLQAAESTAAAGAKTSLDDLRNLQTAWRKVLDSLETQGAALAQRARNLESETTQIAGIDKLWRATEKAATAANAPRETQTLVGSVLKASKDAAKRLKSRQTQILGLQGQLSTQTVTAKSSLGTVQQAITTAMRTLLVRDSVPLWESEAQISASRAVRKPETVRRQVDEMNAYAAANWSAFVIHGGIFAALLAGLLWLRRGVRRWTEEEPHLQRAAPILQVPLATALALSFLLKGPLYADAPNLLRAALGALVLLPAIIILRRLLDRHLYPILYSLIVFYALDQVRVAAAGFPILHRWVLLLELVGAAVVFVCLILINRAAVRKGAPRAPLWVVVAVRAAVALLVVALGATVFGFTQLGSLLGTGILQSGYCAVVVFALVRVLEGLTVIALRVRPLTASHIARQHRTTVQDQVSRYLSWAAIVGWAVYTLDVFQAREAVFLRAKWLLGLTLDAGAVHLSLGRLLCFAGAIWASVAVSRLLRFFLSEEVYERVNLSPGLPYAISTISNYLVLLVGFLVALGLLGVDLTKVTIVAGAFSVGLGFGLQNIINNFVSGIILLFERPVKVGDVIQLGDAVGEVRRIGIRASIIRTREGSDIILPNGNLISNQVTNWTYSDRRRAVEIPFTVAAGPDPNHVMALLKDAVLAAQGPGRGGPPPEAYITALAADKVNFVVRAWTDRYEDWIAVRSDLSVALAGALARENIRLAA